MKVKCWKLLGRLLEKAVLCAGFVCNKLGCSHTVKVNAVPPQEFSAPFEKLCIAMVARDAERLHKLRSWCFPNLFWALTRLLRTYQPLKPSETLGGLTSPCTLGKNVQRS